MQLVAVQEWRPNQGQYDCLAIQVYDRVPSKLYMDIEVSWVLSVQGSILEFLPKESMPWIRDERVKEVTNQLELGIQIR